MSDECGGEVPLTDEQRRLVSENLGLVGLHLRRCVPNFGSQRFDRDPDDLYQEGCLGLMRAAASWRPESGIPFAAYALPRIHNVVSRALRCKFSTVYLPLRAARPHAGDRDEDDPVVPRFVSLSGKLGQEIEDRRPVRTDPDGPTSDDATVGARLREKYERAVRTACDRVGHSRCLRDDRKELASILIKERLLIPCAEERRTLRQIARDTRSSFSRVKQCEDRLIAVVHDLLDTDPEFRELRHCIAAQPCGDEQPVDPAMERRFAEAAAEEMVSRYRRADPTARARVLRDLLDRSDADFEEVIRDRFRRLSPHARRRMLADTSPLKSAPRRTDPRRKRARHDKHEPST